MDDLPKHYYTAFIDEAGDPGLRRVRPIDPDGASEWLCLSAVVMRANYDPAPVSWVRSMIENARIKRPDIHFRMLHDWQKRIVWGEMAKLPVRAFVLASNKKNMRGHTNTRAARRGSQEYFYNYCIRLLLERVTKFCFDGAQREGGEKRLIRIVYSERGGHSYAQTKAYQELLKMQAKGGGLYLNKRRIMWEMLDWRLSEAISHKSSAGGQLADIVVSAFYQAVETGQLSRWDNEFAKSLKPIMAMENGSHMDCGLALQPTPTWKAKLNDQQKEIFEFYGYRFWP